MTELIKRILKYIPLERVWVNPDCGLKTRSPSEAFEALKNMQKAAEQVRKEVAVGV